MSGVNFECVPPNGEYFTFDSEQELVDKLGEWGFNKSVRETVLYKHSYGEEKVTIVGFEKYGVTDTFNTVVVQFPTGELSCIHPAYLKEMQSSTFSKETANVPVLESTPAVSATKKETAKPKKAVAATKEKVEAISLPTEKVHFTAKIKEFSTQYNHFTESDDEVIIFENVLITSPEETTIGSAWCGYSKTLKKLDLTEGTALEFDGKIIKKKHSNDVLYKINNPSKIQIS